ncbi:unnamed protein product [Caenorhabditis brenneri]
MAVFAVHFVYRWLVVSENPLLETFNGWKIWLWFSVLLWYGLTWVCTGYFLSAPNNSTFKFIRENVKEIFELEFDEYIYLGPYLYERMDDGTLNLHVMPFIGLGIISATITLIPFVLMHIPAAIMFAFVFLDIDLGVYSAVVSMTIAIYPAVDLIPTIVIVEFILKLFGCFKRTNPMNSSTMESSKF